MEEPLKSQTAVALLSAKQQKLVYYLARGVKPMQAASICGVTPAYVSQLLGQMKQDKEAGVHNAFAQALVEEQELAGSECSEKEQLQVRYLGAEHKVLDALEASLPSGTLREHVAALQVIADIQEKRLKAAMPTTPPGTSVGGIQFNITQITIPAHAVSTPQVQMDGNKRIVAIDNQPMTALTGEQVRHMFDTIKQGQKENAGNRPSAIEISIQNATIQAEQAAGSVTIDSEARPVPDF